MSKKCMSSSHMNVVYASDDRFAEILGVSLTSLYHNNKEVQEICVYILDSGISEDNRLKLNYLAKQYNRKEPVFIQAVNINELLSLSVNADRGSLTQYARLFISKTLLSNLERILYLDCDIIINSSLTELWNLDLHGNTIAALRDSFSKQYRRNIDLEPNDIMFNSGVMLIDMHKWKADNIEEKLIQFIKKKNGNVQQGDQGALNSVLSKSTYCFEPRFNAVTIFFDFSYKEMIAYRKPVDPYSENQIQCAINKPVIIHYTSSFLSDRPWVDGSKHYYVDIWRQYKTMSPWRNTPLWKKSNETGIKSVYKKFSNYLPHRFMISLSSLLQVYGRPIYYSMKRK